MAITIDYGQVCAAAELRAAGAVCSELNIPHRVVTVDCRAMGSGDLANKPRVEAAPESDWWPFRNQLILTIAGMALLHEGVNYLLLGTVKTDQSHADGTLAFVKGIDQLMELQEGAMRVDAPAVEMTTVELIQIARAPIELLAWGHSCHTSEWACGRCRGCNKHRQVMEALGYGNY